MKTWHTLTGNHHDRRKQYRKLLRENRGKIITRHGNARGGFYRDANTPDTNILVSDELERPRQQAGLVATTGASRCAPTEHLNP